MMLTGSGRQEIVAWCRLGVRQAMTTKALLLLRLRLGLRRYHGPGALQRGISESRHRGRPWPGRLVDSTCACRPGLPHYRPASASQRRLRWTLNQAAAIEAGVVNKEPIVVVVLLVELTNGRLMAGA